MTKNWKKNILVVMLQYDYGKKSRGYSGEKIWFYNTFQELVDKVTPFWIDPYIEDTNNLHQELILIAEQVKPDLIFFFPYTNQIEIRTLQYLKEKFETAAWFGDDQWRFDSYSRNYAPYYTYVVTTDPFSLSAYRKLNINAILSEWAAYKDASINNLSSISHMYEVSFVGGYNEVRDWFIGMLNKEGIKVECFGAGWPNGRVTEDQMVEIFQKSKININLSNSVTNDMRFVLSGPKRFARWIVSKKRNEQIKARNFEIPLAGGFQLTNYVVGLERHFNIGTEVAVYSSPEECKKQIEYYLTYEDQRIRILENGYTKVKKCHTYKHRLVNILEEIWG